MIKVWGLACAALVVAVLPFGCGQKEEAPPPPSGPTADAWFEDTSEKVGLDFVHDAGKVGDYFMPQAIGSGAAFFDFDNDGRLDIYLLQNGGPQSSSRCRLYRQLPNGKLQDVSQGSGLDIAGHNMGVAIGDVNNDGWLDVLVTQYNGIKLFLNRGDGTFTDVTDEAGLSNSAWGVSAAFFDYDRDGWLDLVMVCYVDYDPHWPCTGASGKRDFCAPKTFKGRVSRLFHNLGEREVPSAERGKNVAPRLALRAPRFADVTVPSGLSRLPGPGLGVLCADFDGDGWTDIFIANDGQPNRLWINQHNGTFQEEAHVRGIALNAMAQAQAGMGIAYGDVNANGLLDVFVTHLAEETHTLGSQGPRGLFLEKTRDARLLNARWRGTGFGTLFADFNQDGWLDLAIANGRVSAAAAPIDSSLGPFWSWYGERNHLFAGDSKGGFVDISPLNSPVCGKVNVGRGLAQGDFDGDGAVDLLVTAVAGPAKLYRNVAPLRGHWLSIRAHDPALKRDALGCEVRVVAGDRVWVRWLHPAESYLCSSEPRAHFGLGAVEKVDRIEVHWPDGTREAFACGAVDRRIELRKGAGTKIP